MIFWTMILPVSGVQSPASWTLPMRLLEKSSSQVALAVSVSVPDNVPACVDVPKALAGLNPRGMGSITTLPPPSSCVAVNCTI